MRKIVYFAAAKKDVRSIVEYIETNNRAAARKLASDIVKAVTKLAVAPDIGHRRVEFENTTFLSYRVGSYIVVYRYDDANLYVVRVVHGHRDFKKLFRP
jgi:plasmid stabilization system protein ParE